MKKIYYLLMLAIGLGLNKQSFAQKDSSGIYKTTEDFQQRKLSYAINCKTEKHKINTYVFLKDSRVNVKHQGHTYSLKKSEIFGYRTCEGKEFKFVDNKEYSILNPEETVILYRYQHLAHSAKDVSNGMYQPQYFFSKNAFSPLQNLTKTNLKAAFPDNHKFHDALDAQMTQDKSLDEYDSFHKMYKINWLLNENSK